MRGMKRPCKNIRAKINRSSKPPPIFPWKLFHARKTPQIFSVYIYKYIHIRKGGNAAGENSRALFSPVPRHQQTAISAKLSYILINGRAPIKPPPRPIFSVIYIIFRVIMLQGVCVWVGLPTFPILRSGSLSCPRSGPILSSLFPFAIKS